MHQSDVADQRLSLLRSTYPGWDIDRGTDEQGQECWEARLRRSVTGPMRAAGVVEVVQRPDLISLASALSCQARLVHAYPARGA